MSFKVLIACEESQTVCKAFRALGVEAYSNDLKYHSGGRPEWHLRMSAFEAIKLHDFKLMICHPPCTHLCVSGAKHFHKKKNDGRQKAAIDLFMKFVNCDIPHICIENPVGIMSSLYEPPTQIIQPWMFGDEKQKTTCLWLKNLPPLFHSKEIDLFSNEVTHVDKGEFVTFKSGKRMAKWTAELPADKFRGTARSVTFGGIARAMAEQWNDFLDFYYNDQC